MGGAVKASSHAYIFVSIGSLHMYTQRLVSGRHTSGDTVLQPTEHSVVCCTRAGISMHSDPVNALMHQYQAASNTYLRTYLVH